MEDANESAGPARRGVSGAGSAGPTPQMPRWIRNAPTSAAPTSGQSDPGAALAPPAACPDSAAGSPATRHCPGAPPCPTQPPHLRPRAVARHPTGRCPRRCCCHRPPPKAVPSAAALPAPSWSGAARPWSPTALHAASASRVHGEVRGLAAAGAFPAPLLASWGGRQAGHPPPRIPRRIGCAHQTTAATGHRLPTVTPAASVPLAQAPAKLRRPGAGAHPVWRAPPAIRLPQKNLSAVARSVPARYRFSRTAPPDASGCLVLETAMPLPAIRGVARSARTRPARAPQDRCQTLPAQPKACAVAAAIVILQAGHGLLLLRSRHS